MNLPNYVALGELAELLGVTRQTVHNWLRSKRIPEGKKIGQKRMFCVREVLAVVEQNGLCVAPEIHRIAVKPELESYLERGIMAQLHAAKGGGQ